LIALLIGPSCAPPPPPSVEGAADVFRSLHRRIYDVHRQDRDRAGLHAWLAGSFDGEALTEQYVTAFRTGRRLAAQDAAIDVRKVEYGAIHSLPAPDGVARLDVTWSVGGVLHHGEHRHARVNQYRAIYDLAQTSAGPRIVAARMRSASRLRHPILEGGAFDLFTPEADGPGAFLDPVDLMDTVPLGVTP